MLCFTNEVFIIIFILSMILGFLIAFTYITKLKRDIQYRIQERESFKSIIKIQQHTIFNLLQDIKQYKQRKRK